jgi:hypothetical protein
LTISDARKLYFETARFWLRKVKQVDTQTIEDVLALLDWPEDRKHIVWAAEFGTSQVFTSAVMNAGAKLTELSLAVGRHAA